MAIPELVAVENGAKSVEVAKPADGLMLKSKLLKVSELLAKFNPITAVGVLEALIVWDWVTSPAVLFTPIAALAGLEIITVKAIATAKAEAIVAALKTCCLYCLYII